MTMTDPQTFTLEAAVARARVVTTPALLEAMGISNPPDPTNDAEARALAFVVSCVRRHQSSDWGDVCAADRAANDVALMSGGRLLSLYQAPDTGTPFWIITDAADDNDERAFTTIMLPSDY